MFGVVMKDNTDRYLENINNDFRNGIAHGILVANLSYELAIRMGLSEDRAYKIKCAGMVHDIGKLKLTESVWKKFTLYVNHGDKVYENPFKDRI